MSHQSASSSQLPLLSPSTIDNVDFNAIPLEDVTYSGRSDFLVEHGRVVEPNDSVPPQTDHRGYKSLLYGDQGLGDHPTREESDVVSIRSSRDPKRPGSIYVTPFKAIASAGRSIDHRIGQWFRGSRFYGWRMGVLFGCCTSGFVLICNVIMIVVGAMAEDGYNQEGIGALVIGDEETVSRTNTILHILVNTLSTMLLAGSNYTMQVLNSPTRADVDRAHATNRWVDIGILSFRNVRAVSRRRQILWSILAFSSIPLHLFYNASIFKVITNNGFTISTVDINSYQYRALNSTTDSGEYTTGSYTNMSNAMWKDVYTKQYLSTNGDLHIAIDRIAFDTAAEIRNISMNDYLNYTNTGSQDLVRRLTFDSPNWLRYEVLHPTSREPMKISAHAVHAFGKKVDRKSQVQISLYFMIVVVCFNAMKLAVMLCVLLTDKSSQYLVTIGDAAASFLQRSDPYTKGKCMLGREELLVNMGHGHSHPVSTPEEAHQRALRMSSTWIPCTRQYFYSVHRKHKMLYSFLVLICFGLTLLTLQFSSWTWGSASDDYLSLGSADSSAIGTLWNGWLANVPQLILSFCYLSVNVICTAMAGAAEWNRLATDKKGLRVTRPYGSQRSTYFLQLPYRWSLPLIAFSGSLHWLLSQTFFLVRVDDFGTSRTQFKSACGFSALSLFVLLWATLLLLAVVGFVGARSYTTRIIVAASCSLAISASCHAPADEVEPHLQKIQWGVTKDEIVKGFRHCSLSSRPVEKPEEGKRYY